MAAPPEVDLAARIVCPFCAARGTVTRIVDAGDSFFEGLGLRCSCGATGVTTVVFSDIGECAIELLDHLALGLGDVSSFPKLKAAAREHGYDAQVVDDHFTAELSDEEPLTLPRRALWLRQLD